MVVPGSGLVKKQAEDEGLDKIFIRSRFSMEGTRMFYVFSNESMINFHLKERCASTSNRNFEGRQGRGGRTHLVSPGMADGRSNSRTSYLM